jgi:hypothetical protein
MKLLHKEINKIMEKLNTQIISKYFLNVRINQNKKVILFFLLGLVIILSATFFNQEEKKTTNKFFLDSTIPEGYVFVPVSILNGASLSNMIGQHGVVDLYLTFNGKKTKKIASRVKIIQATNEIDSFAVLLKEEQSQNILTYTEPFFAVIQNPTIKSQNIFQAGKNKISIHYQN